MFTDRKPYPTYADSGHQWFGRLPVAWEASRLRGVSQLLVSNVDKLTHEDERPVRLCNYVDVYKNEFITDRPGYMTASASEDEIRRFRVRVDDVAITKDSESWTDIGVPAYVAHEADDLVCGYHLGLLRTRKDRLSGGYLFRALQVPAIATQLHVAAGGVTRYGLSQNDIRSVSVPIPSLSEQAAIVKYLGHANARIDQAIAAKRRLIALLEEQKQALINQAVTRGLDATVPLRDSGIPWLGQIPAHWSVKRGKWLFAETNTRSSTGTEVLFSLRMREGLVPHNDVSAVPILSESLVGYKHVKAGQFVMNRMRAAIGLFDVADSSGLVSPDYATLTPTAEVNSRYFLSLFKTRTAMAEFRRRSTGLGTGSSGFMRLYSEKFGGISMPLPPIQEQDSIITFLESENLPSDAMITRVNREIELLREFRTRLTADVVTGQLDIRDAAALLPELDPADLVSDVIEQDEDDLEAELAASLEEVDA